ncbi:MAG: ABC transporter permease [Planctomycetota bacterium]
MFVKHPNSPVTGWRSRLVTLIGFGFVAAFVTFILGLILADVFYIDQATVREVLKADFVWHALWMSCWTSVTTTILAMVFAVPMGYTLSHHRFWGRSLVDSIVDLPLIFPPLVAGLTLLVFFSQTHLGRWIEDSGFNFLFDPKGIILCQFMIAATFGIRSARTAFDDVDRRLENVALTLGYSRWGVFRRVSLPLAKNGIMAGGILTWARAFGLFGPLIIVVGTVRGRTEVLSTTMFLEQSVGNLKVALAIMVLMLVVALLALLLIRLLGGMKL